MTTAPHSCTASRLTAVGKYNTVYEAILALGASSSIAAWSLWKSDTGQHVWAVFAGLVAVLAILKPFFRLTQKVEQLTKVHTGYRDLHFDLDRIVRQINMTRGLSNDSIIAHGNALDRFKQLAHEAEVKPSERVLRKCQQEVVADVPIGSLWSPKM